MQKLRISCGAEEIESGVLHMSRIRNNKNQDGTMRTAGEALRAVRVTDYHFNTLELVTAKLVHVYLGSLSAEAALMLLDNVLPDAALNGTMGQSGNITVEGEQLAALIDIAAGEMKGVLEDLLLTGEKIIGGFTAEDIETVLQVIESINGKLAVQDVSAEFLGFIMECYRVLECSQKI